MLNRELDHRVKNMLAQIVSICRQATNKSSEDRQLLEDVTNRVTGIASIHELLASHSSSSIELKTLIHACSKPYVQDSSKMISLEGPCIELNSKAVLCLGMVFNELGNNSMKYGALMHEQGSIDVQWQVIDNVLRLSWAENHDGELPDNIDGGLGSQIIRYAIPHELDGESDVKVAGKGIEFKTQKNNLSKLKHINKTESPRPSSVSQTKEDSNKSFGTIIHEKNEEAFSAFDKLCEKYSEPLEKLSASIGHVPECSSPYFRSRVEEYRDDFANYFRKLHGGDMQVNAAAHNFTLELLTQRGKEYHSAERWGVIPKSSHQNQSIYFRPTENGAAVLDRKAEWNMLMHARMPFMFNFPLEKTKGFDIAKDKLFIFQIGTAFFDQNHQNKLDQYPDVFYKLMFGGHLLANKNAVVYADEEPYFTTTLEQMWHCRGLVYLLLIAMSQRFAIEMSSTMQDFIVEVLPETLQVNGLITASDSFPEVHNLEEVI